MSICVSSGCNNNEQRAPLSRSVVCVRQSRLIWAHSGLAQWTHTLCFTARLRSLLSQSQPALQEPKGSDLSRSTAQGSLCFFCTHTEGINPCTWIHFISTFFFKLMKIISYSCVSYFLVKQIMS